MALRVRLTMANTDVTTNKYAVKSKCIIGGTKRYSEARYFESPAPIIFKRNRI